MNLSEIKLVVTIFIDVTYFRKFVYCKETT